MIPLSLPTPRYEIRRRMALRTMRSVPPGRFLEVGCGWGELLPSLADMGSTGVALEPDEAAREIAQRRVDERGEAVRVVSDLSQVGASAFDYLLAFEVLEHIEDDVGELTKWVSLLRPGGLSIISVPAHMSKWSASDVSVGHFRRYERDEIAALHRNSGLEPRELKSYGFPVTAVTSRIRELMARPNPNPDLSMQERTFASSHVSHAVLGRPNTLKTVSLRGLGWLSHQVQRPFERFDLGDGYFVIAEKVSRFGS